MTVTKCKVDLWMKTRIIGWFILHLFAAYTMGSLFNFSLVGVVFTLGVSSVLVFMLFPDLLLTTNETKEMQP